eukprot:GDKJ01055293.1.p1 GENE.GDKJ01055293.1~~GDKJ01055293.1.p1  ORF type:complete len:759 (+),score=183.33 GDKJ01055293.1:1-2277(+)
MSKIKTLEEKIEFLESEKIELSHEMDCAEEEIESLRHVVRELEDQLSALADAAKRVQMENEKQRSEWRVQEEMLRKELQLSREKLFDRDREIEKYKLESENAFAESIKMQTDALEASFESERQTLRATTAKAQQELTFLINRIRSKDELLKKLQTENSDSMSALRKLESENQRNLERKRDLEWAEVALKEFESAVESQAAEIRTLRAQLSTKEADLKREALIRSTQPLTTGTSYENASSDTGMDMRCILNAVRIDNSTMSAEEIEMIHDAILGIDNVNDNEDADSDAEDSRQYSIFNSNKNEKKNDTSINSFSRSKQVDHGDLKILSHLKGYSSGKAKKTKSVRSLTFRTPVIALCQLRAVLNQELEYTDTLLKDLACLHSVDDEQAKKSTNNQSRNRGFVSKMVGTVLDAVSFALQRHTLSLSKPTNRDSQHHESLLSDVDISDGDGCFALASSIAKQACHTTLNSSSGVIGFLVDALEEAKREARSREAYLSDHVSQMRKKLMSSSSAPVSGKNSVESVFSHREDDENADAKTLDRSAGREASRRAPREKKVSYYEDEEEDDSRDGQRHGMTNVFLSSSKSTHMVDGEEEEEGDALRKQTARPVAQRSEERKRVNPSNRAYEEGMRVNNLVNGVSGAADFIKAEKLFPRASSPLRAMMNCSLCSAIVDLNELKDIEEEWRNEVKALVKRSLGGIGSNGEGCKEICANCIWAFKGGFTGVKKGKKEEEKDDEASKGKRIQEIKNSLVEHAKFKPAQF